MELGWLAGFGLGSARGWTEAMGLPADSVSLGELARREGSAWLVALGRCADSDEQGLVPKRAVPKRAVPKPAVPKLWAMGMKLAPRRRAVPPMARR